MKMPTKIFLSLSLFYFRLLPSSFAHYGFGRNKKYYDVPRYESIAKQNQENLDRV